MYILNVFGGEYEDKFEHHYYSNTLEELKIKGMHMLDLEDVLGFIILELSLEETNIVSELDAKLVSHHVGETIFK